MACHVAYLQRLATFRLFSIIRAEHENPMLKLRPKAEKVEWN